MNYQTGSRIKESKVSTVRRDWDTFHFCKLSSYSDLILHYKKCKLALMHQSILQFHQPY